MIEKEAEVYKFMECNKSMELLIEQDLKYPIKTAYNINRVKKTLDVAMDYVMKRFGELCGGNVDFSNLTEEQSQILNVLMGQTIKLEYPKVLMRDIVRSDNVMVSPKDIKNISFLFEKTSN